jgi:pyruvate/2-oxoglutarate dehydrogenase complex dihydrolipoamide dehydrogenase (E3) component
MNTAIIERHRFGGTCVNVGCIPTKALVASARAAHVARRAADFGVVIDGAVGVDMARVKARKDAIARKSEVGVERWLRSLDNCTVYQGHARFEAAHRVRVGDDLLEAERIFINVGARAFVPPFGGLDQVDYLTNSTILDLEVLPEHLIIVGGGYIGLEFAQMYRRFGSQVTLIETGDRLIKRESPDISAAVTEILEAEGVRVRLNAQCIGVGSQGDAVTASVDCTAGAPEVVGSHLLLAVGRRPNTDDLGLDAAGIEVDRRGLIPVDETLQTAVAGVWALGECNGRGAFTHTAYNDYEIVSANLLHDDPRSVADRIDCYALYIDPPLGRVGMTEQQVRASGRPALIATRAMTRVGRAVEKGETQGFMKVLVDAGTSRILGAAILGVGGDEVIHSILDVMYAEAPYTVIQRAVHIHPTVAELIPTMLADLKPLGG